ETATKRYGFEHLCSFMPSNYTPARFIPFTRTNPHTVLTVLSGADKKVQRRTCSRVIECLLVAGSNGTYSFFNFVSRAKRKALKRSIFFTAASRRASSCFSASLISASRLLLRSKTDSATTRVLVSSINVPSFWCWILVYVGGERPIFKYLERTG